MKRRHVRHRVKKVFNGNRTVLLQYIIIGVIILCGVVWGAMMARQSGTSGEKSFSLLIQETLSKNAVKKGFLNLLLSSFFSSSLLLCVAFILGLCAVGSPGQIAIMLFKGAGIGLSMGYIYLEYGAKGFAICTIFILPWAALTSFAVMISCREGIRYSIYIARMILPSGNVSSLWKEFCDYCWRFLFCFAIILIASLIEAASSIAFSLLFFS